jgi:hypothetical protein
MYSIIVQHRDVVIKAVSVSSELGNIAGILLFLSSWG